MPARPEAPSPTVVDDVSFFIVPGRIKGPSDLTSASGPQRALAEAVDAERLGFRTAWVSERHDMKEAGVILSGAAAVTTRLKLGTGAAAASSRHPLVMASLAATMQSMHGGRFILGLGRGGGYSGTAHPWTPFTYQAFADYIDIIRRLWQGETVSYDGPAGIYREMKTPDTMECDPPEIWVAIMGGPRGSREAARVADGVLLANFLTPEAVHNAVAIIREEREKLGLDPSGVRICELLVTAPDFDSEKTLNVSSARFLTYVIGWPRFLESYCAMNGWDPNVLHAIHEHPLFTRLDKNADQAFFRHQILDAAALVTQEWMNDTCAIGSVSQCVGKMQAYRDAGVDEIAFYGSTPAENAQLIGAWRERTQPLTTISTTHLPGTA